MNEEKQTKGIRRPYDFVLLFVFTLVAGYLLWYAQAATVSGPGTKTLTTQATLAVKSVGASGINVDSSYAPCKGTTDYICTNTQGDINTWLTVRDVLTEKPDDPITPATIKYRLINVTGCSSVTSSAASNTLSCYVSVAKAQTGTVLFTYGAAAEAQAKVYFASVVPVSVPLTVGCSNPADCEGTGTKNAPFDVTIKSATTLTYSAPLRHTDSTGTKWLFTFWSNCRQQSNACSTSIDAVSGTLLVANYKREPKVNVTSSGITDAEFVVSNAVNIDDWPTPWKASYSTSLTKERDDRGNPQFEAVLTPKLEIVQASGKTWKFFQWGGDCQRDTSSVPSDPKRCAIHSSLMVGSQELNVSMMYTDQQANLIVTSSRESGVPMSFSKSGLVCSALIPGGTANTTPCGYQNSDAFSTTVTAPKTYRNSAFAAWAGCETTQDPTSNVCLVNVAAGTTRTIDAIYQPLGTVHVSSTFDSPNGNGIGVLISCTNNGCYSGTYRTPSDIGVKGGSDITMTAPSRMNVDGKTWNLRWVGACKNIVDGTTTSTCTISVQSGSEYSAKATYTL